MSNRKLQMKRITDSIEAVDSVGGEVKKYFNFSTPDLKTIQDKGMQATILQSFKRIMDSDVATEFITKNNYGPYVPELWPIITAWYPEFPLKDLISVQPMDRPLVYMFFTQLRPGTDKSPSLTSHVVETATGLRTIKGSYPTGEVHGEALVANDFDFDATEKIATAALVYYPLNVSADYLASFKIVIATTATAAVTGTWTPSHIIGNTIHFIKGTDDATKGKVTLDIETGGLFVTYPAEAVAHDITSVSASYVWNLESAESENLPSLVEDIIMESAEAKPRALGIKWTIFSEFVKKSQFNKDVRTDITQRALTLIFQMQCRYILDKMYNFSTETERTVVVSEDGVTTEVRIQQTLFALNQIGQIIAKNTGRMQGNRLVVGRTFRSWLESLPTTYFTPSISGDKGYESPYELGKFGPYTVYFDPDQEDTKGFMTYRGKDWADAAYYLGEYMPIVPTDAVSLGVNVRSAFCSMEAHKYHKPKAVIPISFTFGS